MNNGEKQQPGRSGRGQASRQAREERSARALRDNLRRRKAQVRERSVDESGTESSPDVSSQPVGSPDRDD